MAGSNTSGGDVSLREAAARLGVHYMTAYRHVRTGRLPARLEDGQWRVRAADLDHALHPTSGSSRRRGIDGARGRLLDRLLAGDEPGAWSLLEEAIVGGLDPVGAHLELLVPAMTAVGDGWARGAVTIDQEHRAAAVAGRLVGRLGPRFHRPGRNRGGVVLAGAPGDHHTLPVAIAADVVRAARFAVVDLGAAVPPADLARAAANTDQLRAVGICASISGIEEAIAESVAAVHDVLPAVPVYVGGAGVGPTIPSRVGADGYAADAPGLVVLLEGVAQAG